MEIMKHMEFFSILCNDSIINLTGIKDECNFSNLILENGKNNLIL